MSGSVRVCACEHSTIEAKTDFGALGTGVTVVINFISKFYCLVIYLFILTIVKYFSLDFSKKM